MAFTRGGGIIRDVLADTQPAVFRGGPDLRHAGIRRPVAPAGATFVG